MANSTIPLSRNQTMAEVHALGHPSSPLPQTRWDNPINGVPGNSAVPAAVVTPTLYPPNTPAAPVVAQGGTSSLTVTWSAPAVDATHSAATGYNLRSSPSGAGTWTVATGVTSAYTLSSLSAGAAYDVQIEASNSMGVSAWSPATTQSTAAGSGTNAPNAPAIASVSAPFDGTASELAVAWAAPATDGTHAAATGYNLRYSPAGAGTWTTVSGVTSPYTITGLNGAAAYDVEVQGTNAGGAGGWSATVTATTWGATVAPGAWTAASTQTHNTAVAPNGGVMMIVTAAPTAVTGASFAWSASNTVLPTSGLIAAASDGQTNGWAQYFNAPATAGTYYLWMLAQGASGTIGAYVGAAITVS